MHGWGGSPKETRFLRLKKELESRDYKVEVPEMPDTEHPKIDAWVSKLREIVGEVDEKTYFVDHSIGCQTIMRYLESLPENVKVGGVIFVAGWVNLILKEIEKEGVMEIAKPWLETPLNWAKITKHTKNFIAIFSDDDQYVPLSDTKIFKEKLGAEIIVLKGKGHNIIDLSIVRDKILEMAK